MTMHEQYEGEIDDDMDGTPFSAPAATQNVKAPVKKAPSKSWRPALPSRKKKPAASATPRPHQPRRFDVEIHDIQSELKGFGLNVVVEKMVEKQFTVDGYADLILKNVIEANMTLSDWLSSKGRAARQKRATDVYNQLNKAVVSGDALFHGITDPHTVQGRPISLSPPRPFGDLVRNSVDQQVKARRVRKGLAAAALVVVPSLLTYEATHHIGGSKNSEAPIHAVYSQDNEK